MVDLGRVKLHDEQSREHAFKARRATTKRNVRHSFNAKHVDQFYLGGCVGFSVTNMMNCAMCVRSRTKYNTVLKSKKSTRYLDNNDGIRNYSESTKRDPFPWVYEPDDEGSSALGVMKYLKELGVISEYKWTFTFDDFLAALTKQPVLVGTNWYDDMMTTDEAGIISSGAQGDGGGHEYLANEIIWAGSRKYGRLWKETHIGHEQSWGEDPGNFSPHFFMPASLSEELIIRQEGDVAVPQFL